MTGLGLTNPQMRALKAVYDLSGEDKGRCDMVSPRLVALELWPSSPAWDRRPRHINGSFGGMGATMPMKAGVLLWRLSARGLVQHHPKRNLWAMTDTGLRVVATLPQTLPIPDLEKTP
jgi:hypothetical protein